MKVWRERAVVNPWQERIWRVWQAWRRYSDHRTVLRLAVRREIAELREAAGQGRRQSVKGAAPKVPPAPELEKGFEGKRDEFPLSMELFAPGAVESRGRVKRRKRPHHFYCSGPDASESDPSFPLPRRAGDFGGEKDARQESKTK